MVSDSNKGSFFYIDRDEKKQIEFDKNGNEKYFHVDWISDCSYQIKSDTTKNNKFKALTNSSIIKVEIYKTILDTAYYQTYLIRDKEEVIATKGRMIKINNIPRIE